MPREVQPVLRLSRSKLGGNLDPQDGDSTMLSGNQSRNTRGGVSMPQRTRCTSRIGTVLLAATLFAIAFAHYESGVDTTDLQPDESRWINRAHYLTDLQDPFGPTWNDQYLTRGQPPVGSYVMGLGFLVQGENLDTNPAWDYRRGWEWNTQNGMYPSQEDLRTGRMTNVFLGSVAVVLTFLAVRLLSNAVGGVIAATILIVHPLQSWHSRLALADTTLTLTLAAMILVLILLMRRPGWFKALTVGILIGIGGANKLTPLALAFVIAAVGFVMFAISIYTRYRESPSGAKFSNVIPPGSSLSWMLMSVPVVAGATFVAMYPYLWPHPIDNTAKILDFRQQEMDAQARIYPKFAVDSTWEAIQRTWISLSGGTNDSGVRLWSATDQILGWLGLPELGSRLGSLDLIFAIVGLGLLFYVGTRITFRSGHLIVALVLAAQVLTIVFSMRADFERYYLPIVLATAVLTGSGLGLLMQPALSFLQGRLPIRKSGPSHQASINQHRAEVTGS